MRQEDVGPFGGAAGAIRSEPLATYDDRRIDRYPQRGGGISARGRVILPVILQMGVVSVSLGHAGRIVMTRNWRSNVSLHQGA